MKWDRVWFVYRLFCRPMGLAYYGSTSNPTERLHQHRYTKSGAPRVRAARDLYGADSFEFEIVAWFGNKAECLAFEKHKISEDDTIWPNGLNLIGKGRGVLLPNMNEKRRAEVTEYSQKFWKSDGAKERHKAAMDASPEMQKALKRNGEFIKAWASDPDNRKRLSDARKGHSVSEETRQKISASNKGKKRTAEQLARQSANMRGKKASDETKKNMSEAAKASPKVRETIAKMAEINTGKKRSRETCEKIAAARRAYWANRKLLDRPQGEA